MRDALVAHTGFEHREANRPMIDDLVELASPSNPILNTPSSSILNSWVEWTTQLGKLKLLLQPS